MARFFFLLSHASHTLLPNIAKEENYGHELRLDIAAYGCQIKPHLFNPVQTVTAGISLTL
jgi:hypothetical protein